MRDIWKKSNLFYYEKLTGLPVLGKLPLMTEDELNDPKTLAKLVGKNVALDTILKRAAACYNG